MIVDKYSNVVKESPVYWCLRMINSNLITLELSRICLHFLKTDNLMLFYLISFESSNFLLHFWIQYPPAYLPEMSISIFQIKYRL